MIREDPHLDCFACMLISNQNSIQYGTCKSILCPEDLNKDV